MVTTRAIDKIINRLDEQDKKISSLEHNNRLLIKDNKELFSKIKTIYITLNDVDEWNCEHKEVIDRLNSLYSNSNICFKPDLDIIRFDMKTLNSQLSELNLYVDDLEKDLTKLDDTLLSKLKVDTRTDLLTDKQKRVYELYNKGLTNNEIIKELKVTKPTLYSHFKSIKNKGIILE